MGSPARPLLSATVAATVNRPLSATISWPQLMEALTKMILDNESREGFECCSMYDAERLELAAKEIRKFIRRSKP